MAEQYPLTVLYISTRSEQASSSSPSSNNTGIAPICPLLCFGGSRGGSGDSAFRLRCLCLSASRRRPLLGARLATSSLIKSSSLPSSTKSPGRYLPPSLKPIFLHQAYRAAGKRVSPGLGTGTGTGLRNRAYLPLPLLWLIVLSRILRPVGPVVL